MSSDRSRLQVSDEGLYQADGIRASTHVHERCACDDDDDGKHLEQEEPSVQSLVSALQAARRSSTIDGRIRIPRKTARAECPGVTAAVHREASTVDATEARCRVGALRERRGVAPGPVVSRESTNLRDIETRAVSTWRTGLALVLDVRGRVAVVAFEGELHNAVTVFFGRPAESTG